ncbi:DNA-directed DNA polymerase II small subunit [Haladaptatus sp. F3-133]|jgi:DNA polymerase II small subunit|uniref:DNA polymerase II small subunit n=1 Tax=Halorutilus salinus TaxID=2487751 RepID=A0A9Q4GK97_9EURY|nr:DNA-directed DNA polymerase II small subunit [Halorutilus salinus]MCX2819981.1 DNA-directed DNA polymerase II small subunit [Halorutilus salinus]
MPLSSEREVVRRLAEEGLNASPDAVARIAGRADADTLVRALVRYADGAVVTRNDVSEVVDALEGNDEEGGDDPDDTHDTHTPSSDDLPASDPPDRPADSPASDDDVPSSPNAGDARTDGAVSPADVPADASSSSDGTSSSNVSSSSDGTSEKPPSSDGNAPNPPSSNGTEPSSTSPDGTAPNPTSSNGNAPDQTSPNGTVPPTSDTSSTTTHREPSPVDVSNDITGESTCTGEYAEFVGYFRDRFDRLSKLLRSRIQPRTVDAVESGGKDVALVGMVNDVRTTSSDRDNRLVEIEDPTGEIRLLLSDELVDVAERLVVDEVIGVEGRLSDDAGMVFVNDVHFPEVPSRREPSTASRDVKAVLISDIHVGSETFVRDRWELFADWLGRQDDVEYLLVGGDMVEGVGVYPGQDEELTTVDIYEQYADCAGMFDALPDDIQIVTITGNHDSVRLAEPQPALDERFREPFADNVSFHGNPSVVSVEGVDVLMYHGMSLNPFAESVPEVEIESPETAMVEMLRKRHLAPMYGDVRLAPEKEDYLVIDEPPDVLHTGHTHTVGAEEYRNVLTVNTGAWQAQTPYQKSMNIQPDVGYAAVLDLSTLELKMKEFVP